MKKLLIPLILFFILLLAFLLGSRMILSGDFYFLSDQARDFLLAKDITENNHITLIGTHSGLGGVFHGPLWLYLLTPFYLLGGGNPFTFTYLFLVIPLVTVIVGYFVGASLYNKYVGLLIAFLLAVSPRIFGFTHSTQGLNLVPFVYLLLVYFIIKYIRGDTFAFVFAAFFAGFTFQFETATALVLMPIIVLVFFMYGRKAWKQYKIIALSILSFSFSLATFILFDLRHQFLMFRSLLGIFSQSRGQGYMPLQERVASHLGSLQSVYESVLVGDTLLLRMCFAVLFLTSVYLVIKKKYYKTKIGKEYLFLLILPMLFFLFYMPYAYPIYSEYIVGLTIPAVFFASLAIVLLWRKTWGKVLVTGFLSLTLFFALFSVVKQYLYPYIPDRTSGSYRNQKAVADWIFHDAKGKEFGYFVYTPETFTYGMDYLMWYEGKKQGFIPESKKEQNTYLIMYPSLKDDAGAHAFWKENKIKTTSKVVKSKTFTGGIVVEKLAMDKHEPPVDPTYHQDLIFR